MVHAGNDRNKWYVSGGGQYMLDTTIDFSVTPSLSAQNKDSISVDMSPQDDVSYNVAIGRQIGNIRLEVEALWVEYNMDAVTYSSIVIPYDLVSRINTSVAIDGNLEFKVFLANIYYDWDRGKKWVPYVGVGAGVSEIELDAVISLSGRYGLPTSAQVDEVPTYQAIVGTEYELSRNTSAYLDIRNLWVKNTILFNEIDSVISRGDSSFIELPQATLGLRIKFGKRDRSPYRWR